MSPLMQKVLEFIVSKHAGQYRKHSGLPYVFHPIEVCKTLSSYGINDEVVLNAALCHDILEDTETTFNELCNVIGNKSAVIVAELTYSKKVYENKAFYLESFRNKSKESIVIKAVDRYCNILDFYNAREKDSYWLKYYEKSKIIFDIYNEVDSKYHNTKFYKLFFSLGYLV